MARSTRSAPGARWPACWRSGRVWAVSARTARCATSPGTTCRWSRWAASSCGWAGSASTVARSRAWRAGQLGTVLLNTYLGGCAGGIGALAFMRLTGRPILMSASVNGSLCGLVSLTGGAATLNPMTAILTGLIAGALCTWGAEALRRRRIDDTVDAIAVHGLGGTWGLLAAGLFFQGDMFNGGRVMVQAIGAVAAFAWAFPMAYVCFKLVDKLIGLRAPTLNEQRGLDYTEHHEIGYPGVPELAGPAAQGILSRWPPKPCPSGAAPPTPCCRPCWRKTHCWMRCGCSTSRCAATRCRTSSATSTRWPRATTSMPPAARSSTRPTTRP